jgi:DNA-binding transcriptional MerR regulator
MRIGELAVKSGVSRDTIRFYERNGLITSQAGLATTNNYRVYPDDSLIWLGFLTGAREAGSPICAAS